MVGSWGLDGKTLCGTIGSCKIVMGIGNRVNNIVIIIYGARLVLDVSGASLCRF